MNNILSDALQGVKSVAIGGHVRPDGDCVGACCGLADYLKQTAPELSVTVYLETVPESYQRATEGVHLCHTWDEDCAYDLFIALDCGDEGRLGAFAKYFDQAKKTLCIDHHISNQAFADLNEIRPKASSTCEILYDLMDPAQVKLETANSLYMGIMCDTGCFKHSNTSEWTMTVAGKLISKGVNTSKMMDEVFYEKTYMQNQLLGRCLLNSRLYLKDRCILCVVPASLMEEYHAQSSDLEGVIDQLRITRGVEVAVLITEGGDGTCKLSMRSCEYVDVAAIAGSFGGGGHVRAAGATVQMTPEALTQALIGKLEEQI